MKVNTNGVKFRVGEVWISPRNFLYKVVSVEGEQATLRLGSTGYGRIVRRNVDAIKGWSFYEDLAQHHEG